MLNVRDAKTKDGREILNLVKDFAVTLPSNKELKEFIKNGYAKVLTDGKTIKGVIIAYTCLEYNEIAFFYISPELRRKHYSSFMFVPVFQYFDPTKPIYIISKDIETFKNRVEHIEGYKYKWIGTIPDFRKGV